MQYQRRGLSAIQRIEATFALHHLHQCSEQLSCVPELRCWRAAMEGHPNYELSLGAEVAWRKGTSDCRIIAGLDPCPG